MEGDMAQSVDAWAGKALGKMSEARALVDGFNWTGGSERACVA